MEDSKPKNTEKVHPTFKNKQSLAMVKPDAMLKKGGRRKANSQPSTSSIDGPRILVVDDDVSSITPLQQILTNFDCQTTLVFDGFGAIEKLLETKFDLLILDWVMPGISGAETIKEMNNILSFENSRNKDPLSLQLNLPVVTYSSIPLKELYLPNTNHFYYMSHWEKPLRYPQLTRMASDIIDQIKK